MSVVELAAVAISDDGQLEIRPFSDHPTAHSVSYVHLALMPCEGSEPIPSMSDDEYLIRLARKDNCLVWRSPEDERHWSNPDDRPTWIVAAERILVDPETGEQSVLVTSRSVQVGDLIYVEQRDIDGSRSPRRRLLGRVKYICTCV